MAAFQRVRIEGVHCTWIILQVIYMPLCVKKQVESLRKCLKVRSICMECLTWVLSFCLDLDMVPKNCTWFKLGRYNTRGVSRACVLCNCECESVEHVLWECSPYSNVRSVFINSLSKILYSDFHLKSSFFEKTKFIFNQSVQECNGHFAHWFRILKTFCVMTFGIYYIKKNFIL